MAKDYIDADFEIVRELRPKLRKWNGVGIPPAWPTWGIPAKLTYVAVFGGLMWCVGVAAHWVAHLIAPLP